MKTKTLFLTLTLAVVALSGCIGADDEANPTTSDEAPLEATATDETGAVEGKVFNIDLVAIEGAAVALVQGTEIMQETKTVAGGRYVFNDVAPGEYKVQASAICCRSGIKAISVDAGNVATADLQLPILTADDLASPYVEKLQWDGFISCGIGVARKSSPVGGVSAALCSITEGTAAEDPNEDFSLDFPVREGLKSILVGVDWTPVGGVSGTDLYVALEDWHGCSTACSDVRFWSSVAGQSGIQMRADHDDNAEITDATEDDDEETVPEDFDWDNYIVGEDEFRFRVFADGDANLLYQQPFTVHYHLFYHEKGPQDYNPIPDN